MNEIMKGDFFFATVTGKEDLRSKLALKPCTFLMEGFVYIDKVI